MALKNGDLISRFQHLVSLNTHKLVANNSRLLIVLRFLGNNNNNGKFYCHRHKTHFDEALISAVCYAIVLF